MSKIICDICGTSYPENAKQCPVCGCVRPGDVQRVTNEISAGEKGASGYTHVKGGRFTKSNVKKRNKVNNGKATAKEVREKTDNMKAKAKPVVAEIRNEKEPRNNRGLAIVAIVLLLVIIGVVIYIAMGFFDNIAGTGNNPSNPTGQAGLSCQDIILDTGMVDLEKAGNAQHLGYKLLPEDTTDKITFTSENSQIATVDEKGNITAVAEGETKIIIKCGNVEKTCAVRCKFVKETLPTIAPTTPSGTTDTTGPVDPTTPEGSLLNRTSITLTRSGDSWELYSGDAAKNMVTYTSEDERIAKFADGKVVAVGEGITTVYASYNGQKVGCIVRCSFYASSSTDNDGIPVNRKGKVYNVQANLNVRSGPDTTYDKVGLLLVGQEVTIYEIKYAPSDRAQWGRIDTGWVNMGYIKLDTQ